MITGTAPYWATSGSTTITTPTITGKPTFTQSSESASNTFFTLTQAAHTGGTPTGILFTGGAHTTLAAATESNDVRFDLSQTKQFTGGGTFNKQRAFRILPPTYSATSSTTITDGATIGIRQPIAGTNVTLTNNSALIVTDASEEVHVALNASNVSFGAVVFGSGGADKTARSSVGPASKSTGTSAASGTAMRFYADLNAATVGAYQFTTIVGNTTILNNGASIFINASPTYLQSASAGASHSVIRTGFTFTHGGTTGNTLTGFLADPTIDVTNTNASVVRGFAYTPTMTNLNSSSSNKAWYHNSGWVQWDSSLSPSQITSNQNDYNPNGLNHTSAPYGASILRLNSDAARDITSLVGGANGRLLIALNVGSFNITFKNDDGSSGTAANRFALSADFVLAPGTAALLWYDGTSSRWRIIG
jgi:hypothetical protein